MEFHQVDVFAERPFRGNPLAVFPDAGEMTRGQMQAIASEMNLSECSFVTNVGPDDYSVRIFTPRTELGFAGHPTIGTAWVLARLGKIRGSEVTQRSSAGTTTVRFDEDRIWFVRSGEVFDDLESKTPQAKDKLAKALGLSPREIGLEPRELGRSRDRLGPALTDAGLKQLVVPVEDAATLGRCRPVARLLEEFDAPGVYCFTALGAGLLQARGFFPALGIEEDPATGSAAAGLGLYLADRIGPIEAEIAQGVEMGRPSRIYLRASERSVQIGGRCEPVAEGKLLSLP